MIDQSFFASDAVQEKEVGLGDGKMHKLHFREYSGAAFNSYAHAVRSDDLAVKGGAMAILIADSLCNEKGERQLTVAQASNLKPQAMQAIFRAVLEANQVGQDDAGNT